MRRRWLLVSGLAGLLAILVTAGDGRGQVMDRVTLQLKWVTQAQFAGYYAAKASGFYAAENLDVTIRPGGPDIVSEQIVVSGGAQFGLDWLPSLLHARDRGMPLVNIAQVFAFSGMRLQVFRHQRACGPSGAESRGVVRRERVRALGDTRATLEKYRIDRDKLSLHVVGAATNGFLVEFIDWTPPDLFEGLPRCEDGHFRIPDRPGHGIALAPGAQEKYALS